MQPRAGIARASVLGLGVELTSTGCAFASSVVVARHLGPGGKGVVSTLTLLAGTLAAVSGLAAGEVAITMVRHRRVAAQRVLSASLGILLASSAVGMAALVLLAGLVLRGTRGLGPLIGVAAAAVPLAALAQLLSGLLDAQDRLLLTRVVRGVVAVVGTLATAALVLYASRGIFGAALASTLVWALAAVALMAAVRRSGLRLRPTWDFAYAREAFPIAIPLQMAGLLYLASSRLDLLLVQAFRGSVSAGHYSVALTLSQLVTYGPLVISTTSYPTVAALADEDVSQLALRVFRTSIVVAIILGAGLALASPLLTPMAFGQGFRPAVAPTLILLVAAIFTSAQWVLGRIEAARGNSVVLLRSLTVNVITMMVADCLLIPVLGIVGAAIGSVAGSVAGLAVALRSYRHLRGPASLTEFLPTHRDLGAVNADLRSLLGTIIGRGGGVENDAR